MPDCRSLARGAFLCLLLAAAASFASGQTLVHHFLNGWFVYTGDHAVSNRWGVHMETQVRRTNFITGWQQLLLRPGVNFELRPGVTLSAGYVSLHTWAARRRGAAHD